MSDANKAVIRRWFEEGMEKGNLDIIEELFAETYVFRMPGVTVTGRGGATGTGKQLQDCFSRHEAHSRRPDCRG